MAFFEVYIPARDASGMNLTLTVEAQNWLGALRAGLANSGEGAEAISNVMCDIQNDNSIHVTDSTTDRVFRLREVAAPEGVTEQNFAEAAPEVPATQPPSPEPTSDSGPVRPSMPVKAPPRPQRFQSAPQPINRAESKPAPSDPSIGRKQAKVNLEDVLADIFERTMELYGERLNPDRIVNDLLDLAVEKVPSGAGSFYVADISSHDLQFAAVRGPKSKEILQSGIRVSMGQGIAGFCAQEGVALAVSDAQKDPRFARDISDKIGYEAHSMICVPLDKDGRCYGAIQLINKQGGTTYSEVDLSILAAVGQQATELLAQVQT